MNLLRNEKSYCVEENDNQYQLSEFNEWVQDGLDKAEKMIKDAAE